MTSLGLSGNDRTKSFLGETCDKAMIVAACWIAMAKLNARDDLLRFNHLMVFNVPYRSGTVKTRIRKFSLVTCVVAGL